MNESDTHILTENELSEIRKHLLPSSYKCFIRHEIGKVVDGKISTGKAADNILFVISTSSELEKDIREIQTGIRAVIERMIGESCYINPEAKGHYEGCMGTYKAILKEIDMALDKNSLKNK